MAESGQPTTLFCPTCDYNLTGLSEQRCPECGTEFDPDAIRRFATTALKPIGFWTAIFHLLWPPVAFSLLVYLCAISDLEWLFGTLIVCTVIYTFVNGAEMGIRTAATLSIRIGGSPYSHGPKGRLYFMTFAFILTQWTLVVGGVIIGLRLAY